MSDYPIDQDYKNLKRDISDTGKAVNEDTIVEPRYGDPFLSLPAAIRTIVENGLLGAVPYTTKSQLDAALTNHDNDDYAVVTNDKSNDQPTEHNGFYQKQEGEWVFLAWNPVIQFMQNLHNYVVKMNELVQPLAITDADEVPIWLTKAGDFGFNRLDVNTLNHLKNQMGLLNSSPNPSFQPIVLTAKNEPLIWFDREGLNFAQLSNTLINNLKNQLNISDVSPEPNVEQIPIFYNERNLNRFFAQCAKAKALGEQVKVLITGDSWTEYREIPSALRDILIDEFGKAGTGFLSVNNYNMFDSVSVAKTGTWTLYDASITTTPPIYGCAPDGHSLSSSVVGSKINVSNLVDGDELYIFYGNADGSFSYKLNGGSASSITTTSSQSPYQNIKVSGLSGSDTFEIEVLDGTVAIHGFLLRKSTGSGIELSKTGNAGITGRNFGVVSPVCQAGYASVLKPDLVVIILGTNDYRGSASTTAQYSAAIKNMIDGYRTGNAHCSVILVAPSQSDAVAVSPLAEYRDALYAIAETHNCVVYSALDDWSDYTTENNLGMWKDSLHVSTSGGYRIANAIYQNLLKG